MYEGGKVIEKRLGAAYIRVSTEEQTELSPDSQLEEICRYADREQIQILQDHIYLDAGISGKKAENRPEFMRMIAEAKRTPKPFSVILLWKYSRFARNQEESIFYKSILRSRCGIEVISVTEPLTDGPFGSLIERIIEWMDEFYSIRLSQEVKRSMKVNAEHGKLQCPAAFGYEARNGVLLPKENESECVKYIFESFISGKSLLAIARELNDRGIRTHRGNRFESRTIEYILRNPVYIGKLRWNPTGRTRRNFSNENIIISNGSHEAIVSEKAFVQVQDILDKLKNGTAVSRPTHSIRAWTSGLVRCALCGSTLVFAKPCYYKCSSYIRGKCKSSQHIRADLLENALICKFKKDSECANELRFDIVFQNNSQSNESAHLESSLRALDARKKRLQEAYLSGEIELSDFAPLNSEIHYARRRIVSELESLCRGKGSAELTQAVRQAVESAMNDFEPSAYDAEIVNRAMREVIERCIFDKERSSLEITYRLDIIDDQV